MKYLFGFLLTFVLVLPLMATAQTGLSCSGQTCTYTPLEPLPCPPAAPNCQSATNNFPVLVSMFFRLVLTFGALFAVVMLTVAGIGYMLSEAAVDIGKAKDRAKQALIGLLILTSSWLILNTVNPQLLNFKLLVQPGPQAPAQTSSGNITVTPTNAPAGTIGSLILSGGSTPEKIEQARVFHEDCVGKGGVVKNQDVGDSNVGFFCVK